MVKFHLKTRKISEMLFAVAFNQFFGWYSFLAGGDHHRGAVGVVGAEVSALMAAHFLKADPEISLQILDQMAEMNVAVGIG